MSAVRVEIDITETAHDTPMPRTHPVLSRRDRRSQRILESRSCSGTRIQP